MGITRSIEWKKMIEGRQEEKKKRGRKVNLYIFFSAWFLEPCANLLHLCMLLFTKINS